MLQRTHFDDGVVLVTLNELVKQAVTSAWLYLVLIAVTLIDGFFPPVPSETMIVAAASIAVSTGETNVAAIAVLAMVGASIGDNIAFLLGRWPGNDRFRWMRQRGVAATFMRAQRELDRRGAMLILGTRYIPGGRVAVKTNSSTASGAAACRCETSPS